VDTGAAVSVADFVFFKRDEINYADNILLRAVSGEISWVSSC
jgi:hypothetical protein